VLKVEYFIVVHGQLNLGISFYQFVGRGYLNISLSLSGDRQTG
jgi:hypothetical protein